MAEGVGVAEGSGEGGAVGTDVGGGVGVAAGPQLPRSRAKLVDIAASNDRFIIPLLQDCVIGISRPVVAS